MATNKLFKMTESTLQSHVRTLLISQGYTVMETGKGRSKQRCIKCGNQSYATGWQGNTKGLPDLYIHCARWGKGVALAIELKTEKGVVRDEQKKLEEDNLTYICRSVGNVIEVIQRMEQKQNNQNMVDHLERIKEINGF